MLLLTRVDEVNKEVRKKPIGKYQDLEKLKQKAATILNIQSFRILYNVNYVAEDKRSFGIDQGTYKVLERIASIAVQKTELDVANNLYNKTTITSGNGTSSNKRKREW